MIFYTGSYTEIGAPAPEPKGKGIGCFIFDEANCNIELLRYTDIRNPSYLTISADGEHLYAVEELPESQKPEVFSFKIGSNGDLVKTNAQSLKGDYACHLAIAQDQLVVANYGSGNAVAYLIQNDGSLNPYHQIIQHKGNGPDKKRQEGPHVHMVYVLDYHHLLLVNLGTDSIKGYGLDNGTRMWIPAPELDIKLEPGAGPRHMVMDKDRDTAFVLSELSASIYVYKRTVDGFIRVQKMSLVPKGYHGAFGAADLRMHPNGKFLYASNRGPDTISVFNIEAESERFSGARHFKAEGKTPRDFNIHPSGKCLIAANQDSNELAVFEIDSKDGALHFRSKTEVATPVNIIWLHNEV